MNRRAIFKTLLFTVATSQFYGKELIAKVFSPLGKRSDSLASLLFFSIEGDKIDKEVNYIEGYNKLDIYKVWVSKVDKFFNSHITNLSIPKKGQVVEFGSYHGDRLDILKELFPENSVMGLDGYKYTDREDIIISDVRDHVKFNDYPISLAWSNVGTWKSSPRSKLAAHNFLMRNIVIGGYLIEDSMAVVPPEIQYPGFKIIADNGFMTLLKKVSNEA